MQIKTDLIQYGESPEVLFPCSCSLIPCHNFSIDFPPKSSKGGVWRACSLHPLNIDVNLRPPTLFCSCFSEMATTVIFSSLLLMISQCSGNDQEKYPLPKGMPKMQSLKELSIGPHGEKESSPVNSDETSNLIWVPIKGNQIPNNTVSIYNDYSSRLEYVCRAKDYCTFGFLTLAKGFSCFFPFLKQVAYTNDFDVLVNKHNFELLEWKSGPVSNPGITFCQDNFVGKNKYGLGDVYKGHFYLPWKWELYRYSSYDVLTVNRKHFNMHYSDVTYFIDQANRTKSPPYAMKMSQVINQGTEEVMENVRIEVMTEKTSQWECGLDLSLSSSTSITAGIPDMVSEKITVCVDVTMALDYGRSKSQSVTQSQEVSVQVPPGNSCVVKMMGRKVEVEIPFQARVTKTYQDGTIQHSTVTGVYTGVQVGEIIMEVDHCEPLGTTTPKA